MRTGMTGKNGFFRSLMAAVTICCLALSATAAEYAAESVLASGKWVKIQVAESGLYQLTSHALSKWGFSDISKIRIYGYGGAMISETMGDGYVDDLPQIPVWREKNKIVFYAQGPMSWEKNQKPGIAYTHTLNPYASAGYYFITDREDIGTAEFEATGIAANAANAPLITSFTERIVHEQELAAPGKTSRLLLGEDFKHNMSQGFSFDLTGKLPRSGVKAQISFYAKIDGGSAKLRITASGGNKPTESQISGVFDSYGMGKMTTVDREFSDPGEKMSLAVDLSPISGSVSLARLNYIALSYSRSLRIDGTALAFRSHTPECRDSVFSIENATEKVQIWDITTGYAPKCVNTSVENTTARFRQTEPGIREYIAFDPDATFPAPVFVKGIENQNLHGTETPTMLIITPPQFRSEAQRIAMLHEETDGMKVAVADEESIFNEFSSGTPDAMAYRKICKMWWERSKDKPENSNERFRYLLLFGRSIFDNRQLTAEGKSIRYPVLLTWESHECESESSSYNTDDVFGALEDGSNVAKTSSGYKLDIAIGRMPVKSIEEAKTAVDKLYSYVRNAKMDSWRNNILMIADDENSGDFLEDSEQSAEALKQYGAKQYVYNLVYLDAFKQESSGTGRSYPAARSKMLQSLRDGVIYASYIGHANPTSWTDNGLLSWSDIQDEFYYKNLPLLFTATCEFTRWDDSEVSGGELLFLNEQGGAIALITSSRQTGISPNGELSKALCRTLFNPQKDGNMPRVGDALTMAKNARLSDGGHRLKYALIGDPAMRLKYPGYRTVIDDINGQTLADPESQPEVMARQEVVMNGHIEDSDGIRISDFDGVVKTTVFDSETSVTTHGYGDGKVMVYQDRTNRLFSGADSVKNGAFSVRFRIPSEIANNYTPGMISMYAYSEKKNLDANGSTEQFYVYGYDETITPDTEGPEILLLALNTDSFKDGSEVNETPYLLVDVHDEAGINISTTGIGHGMTLLLDEKTTISGLENHYEQDTEKRGQIRFQMDKIEEGNHTLRFRVWDVFGNMSEKTISFTVVNGLKPSLTRVYTDANPAKTEANFYLQHDRPDAMVTVTISVYNLLGQSVWSETRTGRSDMFTSMPITWNLTDETGRRVNRGIYIYKAAISTDGIHETTAAQKLAVASE